MFNFTKKITMAASFVVIYSGQFAAFASESVDGTCNMKRQLVVAESAVADPTACDPATILPRDVMKLIIVKASQETNPGHMASVNSVWHNIMRENAKIQSDLTADAANPFMKSCMKIYVDNEGPRRFKNGILRCTPENGGEVIELKFSELANPYCGTFDLSKCGDMSQNIRITTSVEEFFKVRGENKDKLVFLTCPFHVIEQAIQSNPDHPFSNILLSWDKSKAPIGMFWRWGNWPDSAGVDYLVSAAVEALSEKSIYENWQKSVASELRMGAVTLSAVPGRWWSVRFRVYFSKTKIRY